MDNDLGEGHRGQRNGCQFGPWVGGIWKPVPSGISSNLEACVSPASPCYRGHPMRHSWLFPIAFVWRHFSNEEFWTALEKKKAV